MSGRSDNLLGKADAFLKRYRASGSPGQDEVPVLTEVVNESAAPVPPSAQAASPELGDLEKRLKQSLLDGVEPYLKSFLDEPLRARIEDHLRSMLAGLAGQIKADIDVLVRDAVSKAVEQELARLRGAPRSKRS